MAHRSLLLSFLLVGAAVAGDETPAAVVGRMLTAAKEAGALDRALEERMLVFAKGEMKLLLSTRGEKLADGSGVWFEMQVERLGEQKRTIRERCHLLFAGGASRIEVEVDAGPGRGGKGSGDIVDGKCELKLEGEGETDQRSLEWGPDVVSMGVALFLLPSLSDHGLPAELKLRVFEAEGSRVSRFTSVVKVTPEPLVEGETKLREVVVVQREGVEGNLFRARLRAEGEDKGRIHSIEVDGGTMTPIAKDEAEKLRNEAAPARDKDEQAPPPK